MQINLLHAHNLIGYEGGATSDQVIGITWGVAWALGHHKWHNLGSQLWVNPNFSSTPSLKCDSYYE